MKFSFETLTEWQQSDRGLSVLCRFLQNLLQMVKQKLLGFPGVEIDPVALSIGILPLSADNPDFSCLHRGGLAFMALRVGYLLQKALG